MTIRTFILQLDQESCRSFNFSMLCNDSFVVDYDLEAYPGIGILKKRPTGLMKLTISTKKHPAEICKLFNAVIEKVETSDTGSIYYLELRK